MRTTEPIDHVIEELVLQGRRAGTTELEVEEADPTVHVDSAVWLESEHPITCKPQRMTFARGTTPPPIQASAVYCVVSDPPSITDGVPLVVLDED